MQEPSEAEMEALVTFPCPGRLDDGSPCGKPVEMDAEPFCNACGWAE